MGRQAPISLRLITDLNATVDHHCPLCLFLHDTENGECRHHPYAKEIERSQSRFSDYSFYTARTSDSTSNSDGSNSKVRAKVVTTPPKKKPSLKHKTSPTKLSLRELRAQQSRQSLMREQQSNERLQSVYEKQILAYLEGPLSEMGRI